METKFKKGDIVYWQDLQGEVSNAVFNSHYPIVVKFTNGFVEDFTNDGILYKGSPPVLSHTPYTLNGFTQNSVIEKDTLVWVKQHKDYIWQQQFYSHFLNGKHYCFINQNTSKEINTTNDWNYLETKNPLLKKLTPKNK